MVEIYFHSSLTLHGVALNYLNTGTTLTLPPPENKLKTKYHQEKAAGTN
jgi:hypothetical protein